MKNILEKIIAKTIFADKPVYLPIFSMRNPLLFNYIYPTAGRLEIHAMDIIQHMSPDERRIFQTQKIKSLLNYCIKNTPYWQETLKNQTSINQLSDIEQIPVLTKEKIRQTPDSFLSFQESTRTAYRLTTSGSTGLPLAFYIDKGLFLRRAMAVRYAIKCFGYNPWSRLFRLNYQDLPWAVFQGDYFNLFNLQKNPQELFKRVKQYAPDAFYGTVSHLLMLAQVMEKNNYFYPVKFVVSRSEYLSGEHHRYLEKIFGCEIFNIYASREFGPIAQTCSQNNGFHTNEDRFLIEITDENGKAVENGRTGKILITSFYSRAMPLIRYDVGDIGRFLPDKCACGLQTKKIIFEGRTCHFLQLPNGKKFPLLQILSFLCLPSIIKSYQIIQQSTDGIIIKIVPDINYNGTEADILVKKISAKINYPNFFIKMEPTENIELSPTGKNRTFISGIKE